MSLGTFLARAQAERALAIAETASLRGLVPAPEPEVEAERVPTLREAAESWLAARPGLRPRTLELYRGLLDRHIAPTLGDRPLDQLTPAEIESWWTPLAKAHPSTAAKSYRLVGSVLRSAVEDGAIARSPARLRGAGQERAAERPLIDPADLDRLVLAMPPRFRVAVLLAGWCGLRRGELLGLQRQDLDLAAGVVHIRRTRQVIPSLGQIVGPPKSAAGRRTVAVPPHILPALEFHLRTFVGPEHIAWVLTGVKGAPVTPSALEAAWRAARAAADLPEVRLHDLRHASLTWAAQAGATTAELQARAGHADATAAARYQHAAAERDRALAERLSGARYGTGLARGERGGA